MPTATTTKPIAVWVYDSSSGRTKYETLLYDDGTLSCNCPGWVYARKSKRGCTHTKRISPSAILNIRNGLQEPEAYGGERPIQYEQAGAQGSLRHAQREQTYDATKDAQRQKTPAGTPETQEVVRMIRFE